MSRPMSMASLSWSGRATWGAASRCAVVWDDAATGRSFPMRTVSSPTHGGLTSRSYAASGNRAEEQTMAAKFTAMVPAAKSYSADSNSGGGRRRRRRRKRRRRARRRQTT